MEIYSTIRWMPHILHTHLHFLHRLCEHFKIQMYLIPQIFVIYRSGTIVRSSIFTIIPMNNSFNILFLLNKHIPLYHRRFLFYTLKFNFLGVTHKADDCHFTKEKSL